MQSHVFHKIHVIKEVIHKVLLGVSMTMDLNKIATILIIAWAKPLWKLTDRVLVQSAAMSKTHVSLKGQLQLLSVPIPMDLLPIATTMAASELTSMIPTILVAVLLLAKNSTHVSIMDLLPEPQCVKILMAHHRRAITQGIVSDFQHNKEEVVQSAALFSTHVTLKESRQTVQSARILMALKLLV